MTDGVGMVSFRPESPVDSGDIFKGQGGKIERHDDGIDER
jgi:hypothetical protein